MAWSRSKQKAAAKKPVKHAAPALVLKANAPAQARTDQNAGPIRYSDELGVRLCELIAGGASLRSVCMHNGMPRAPSIILDWRADHPTFDKHYTRAVQDRHEYWASEVLDIADTPEIGQKITDSNQFGRTVVEGDMLEHRKLRIDSRRWLLSKLEPKKYGDRTQLEHSGPNGGPIETKEVGIRARNLDAVEALSARLTSGTAGTPAVGDAPSDDGKPDPESGEKLPL